MFFDRDKTAEERGSRRMNPNTYDEGRISYEQTRARAEEFRKKRECDDAEALKRVVSYQPPVSVLKGKYSDFLQIDGYEGPGICAPVPLIAGVSIYRPIVSMRVGDVATNPSAIVFLSVEMASGVKHSAPVELACADMLLDAVNKVWRAPA